MPYKNGSRLDQLDFFTFPFMHFLHRAWVGLKGKLEEEEEVGHACSYTSTATGILKVGEKTDAEDLAREDCS